MLDDKKTNGLVFGKFNPPHNGHLQLIKGALEQTTGDVYLLVFDHPELGGISTKDRADLIKQIIPNDRLHVIECYDPPKVDDMVESRNTIEKYIEEKLPDNVHIDKVFCNEPYGEQAAKQFGAEWVKVDPDRENHTISGTEIRLNPSEHIRHLHPLVAERSGLRKTNVSPCDITFTGAIDSRDLEVPLTAQQKKVIQQQFEIMNSDKSQNTHMHMQDWDLGEFDAPHLPVVIGPLDDKEGFSEQKGIRLLDMAIRMPDQGWAIPKELEQFKETIKKAWDHERTINPNIDDYYVYITVDQKLVQPNKSQRRPGYHSDAFETSETTEEHGRVDHTYIVYDALPTLFQPGPFSLNGKVDPEDCDAVLKYFDKQSEGKEPITYPPHTMVKLTPYDIHTPDINSTDQPIERTFIKISFSQKPYNLVGNRINNTPDKGGKPILDYSNWQWVERSSNGRNHRNHVISWRREDHDKFKEVNASVIDFSKGATAIDWLKGPLHYARRIETSHAVPAIAEERLETNSHGDRITYNIAQAGDWKITTSQGDQYFISDEKFRLRYNADQPLEGDMYQPKGLPQPFMEVAEDVCFRASWGAMQYLPAGSMLTQNENGYIYGIHKQNYDASYEECAAKLDTPAAEVKNPDLSANTKSIRPDSRGGGKP